jgi:hypothetical protein
MATNLLGRGQSLVNILFFCAKGALGGRRSQSASNRICNVAEGDVILDLAKQD